MTLLLDKGFFFFQNVSESAAAFLTGTDQGPTGNDVGLEFFLSQLSEEVQRQLPPGMANNKWGHG